MTNGSLAIPCKLNNMYLVTGKSKSGIEKLIWKYKTLDNAKRDFRDLKKYKYANVHISKIIK